MENLLLAGIIGTGMVVGVVVWLFLLLLARGGTLCLLWGWFMVPLGVPAISLAHALGIACIFGMVTPKPQPKKKPQKEGEDSELVMNLAWPFMACLLSLSFGYVYHLFM